MQLTVDIAVYARAVDGWRMLVVRRARPPFQGAWALPGGKVGADESADSAARRELLEETGLALPQQALRQLSTFAAPGRDPRGRVVSVLYLALVPRTESVRPGSDADDVEWRPQDSGRRTGLAFDHDALVAAASRMAPAQNDTSWRTRPAQRSDTSQILDLHRAALRQVGADAGPGPWDDDLNDVEASYPASSSDFIVAEFGSYLVGMGALRVASAGVGEVKRMRVAPHWQGHGVGRDILGRLEDAARSRGLGTLRLDTTSQQTRALELYASSGYEQVGEAVVAGMPSLLFEKQL